MKGVYEFLGDNGRITITIVGDTQSGEAEVRINTAALRMEQRVFIEARSLRKLQAEASRQKPPLSPEIVLSSLDEDLVIRREIDGLGHVTLDIQAQGEDYEARVRLNGGMSDYVLFLRGSESQASSPH